MGREVHVALPVEPVEVEVEVAVAVLVEVLVEEPPHKEDEELMEDAGRNTLGRPDSIGTGISPFESTVTDVQVYASISSVPEV